MAWRTVHLQKLKCALAGYVAMSSHASQEKAEAELCATPAETSWPTAAAAHLSENRLSQAGLGKTVESCLFKASLGKDPRLVKAIQLEDNLNPKSI